jgi:hypothetical protein
VDPGTGEGPASHAESPGGGQPGSGNEFTLRRQDSRLGRVAPATQFPESRRQRLGRVSGSPRCLPPGKNQVCQGGRGSPSRLPRFMEGFLAPDAGPGPDTAAIPGRAEPGSGGCGSRQHSDWRLLGTQSGHTGIISEHRHLSCAGSLRPACRLDRLGPGPPLPVASSPARTLERRRRSRILSTPP